MYPGMDGRMASGYAQQQMYANPHTDVGLADGHSESGAQSFPNNPADQTGMYLGNQMQQQNGPRVPHVIPNPFDNTILIQGTPQEYEQILGLLRQLDIPPRQVLIDAKIYEVDLNGAFAAGVTAYLDKKDSGPFSRTLTAASGAGGLALTTGALVLRSHELLAALTASETTSHTRVISAPSIIATDSIPAHAERGRRCSGADVAGDRGRSAIRAAVRCSPTRCQNRSTGVTLSIMARVNSSGIVTMVINQNVSAPQPPAASSAHPIALVFEPLLPDADHRAGRRHGGDRRHHPGEQSTEFGGSALSAPAAGNRRGLRREELSPRRARNWWYS